MTTVHIRSWTCFFFSLDISVNSPIIVLKLARTVFTSLYLFDDSFWTFLKFGAESMWDAFQVFKLGPKLSFFPVLARNELIPADLKIVLN